MALWGNVDDAANSTISTPAQFNQAPTAANRDNLFGNTTADGIQTGKTVGVFGVSATEQQASVGTAEHPAHAGWNLRTVGSGGRAGRIHYETLVAMSSISGDDEDVVLPDLQIVITSQPTDDTQVVGNTVTFSVVAGTIPSGGSLSYQWQADGGPGVLTWGNLSDAGVYSDTATATLSISDNTTLNGNVYRVVVSATGADTVNSANATLTATV